MSDQCKAAFEQAFPGAVKMRNEHEGQPGIWKDYAYANQYWNDRYVGFKAAYHSVNFHLTRALEIIATINPTGCGSYERAFQQAQHYAARGLRKHKEHHLVEPTEDKYKKRARELHEQIDKVVASHKPLGKEQLNDNVQ